MDQLAVLQKREEHLRADKLRQYEAYADGVLAKDLYLRNKSSADQQLTEIGKKTSEIENQLREAEQGFQAGTEKQAELASRFHGQNRLTNEMATAFIEAVYIYADDEVKIKWRFQDAIK